MEKKLKFREKLCYGIGDFGSNMTATFVGGFILLYLTTAIGMNAGVVGTLMLVTKIFDGVSDVFFGTLVDHTHTKMGKARPWMFWTNFLCGIGIIAVFSIPTSMGQNVQYAYFFITYTILNAILYTANNIAYSTMSALMTTNQNERVQLGTFRYIFSMTSIVVITSSAVALVNVFGGGAEGWKKVAIVAAVVEIVINTICVLGVKELPEDVINAANSCGVEETAESNTSASLGKTFKTLLHNRFYLLILAIYVLFFLYQGVSSTVGAFYAQFVLGNSAMLGTFMMAQMVPMIIGLLFTPVLVKKFGIYKVNLVAMGLSTLCSIPYMIFGFQGNVTMMLVFTAIRGICGGPMNGTLNALIADAGTYSFLKDGVHVEGSMFSCSSMGIKVGGGIGTALSGWLLAAAAFDGMAEVQTAGALNMITGLYVVAPLVVYILMTLCMGGMNIDKATAQLSKKTK